MDSLREKVRGRVACATDGMVSIDDATDAIMSAFKRITSAAEPKNSADNLESAPSTQNGLGSAVEPSGVVTDEAVDLAYQAWLDCYPIGSERDTREALRAALTAALSSRTEEEVRADEVERICAWVEDSDPELAEAIRARSLANGDEDGMTEDREEPLLGVERLVNAAPLRRPLTNGGG